MGIGTSADGSSSLSLLAAVRKLVVVAGCVAPPPVGAGTPMIFDDSRCLVFLVVVFERDYFCEEFFLFVFFLVEEDKLKEAGETFFFVCVFGSKDRPFIVCAYHASSARDSL